MASRTMAQWCASPMWQVLEAVAVHVQTAATGESLRPDPEETTHMYEVLCRQADMPLRGSSTPTKNQRRHIATVLTSQQVHTDPAMLTAMAANASKHETAETAP
jgi:hypothetical protein